MVSSCCAFNCKERQVKGSPYTFHKFPRDPMRRKRWELSLRRKDFTATNSSRICSKHFEEECFELSSIGSRLLKREAIPTKFDFPNQKYNNIINKNVAKGNIQHQTFPKKHSSSFTTKSPEKREKRKCFLGDFEDSDMCSPLKAVKVLALAKKINHVKTRVIKDLRKKNDRLTKRVASLNNILEEGQEMFLVSKPIESILKDLNMAAEFYHKTAALFEEFKKRELQSINSDKKIGSNLIWKNKYNESTQDYLEKINKHERDTEKSYREFIQHMEDLDKQTDQMSLKLEKLHVLRNIAIKSSNFVSASNNDTFDRPLQSHSSSSSVHNMPVMPPTLSLNVLHSRSADYTLPKSSDESTQTDDVICAQCHSPLVAYHIGSSSKTLSGKDGSAAIMHNMHETINNFKGKEMPSIPSTSINVFKESPSNLDNNTHPNLNYENFQQDVSVTEANPPQKVILRKENASSEVPVVKFVSSTEIPREEVKWSQTDDKMDIDERESAVENPLNSRGTAEPAVSKSDDESMNHEFDFLESDKRSSIKSDNTQLIAPNFSTQSNLETKRMSIESSHDTTFQETTGVLSADAPEFKKQLIHDSAEPNQFDSENMERIKISEDLRPDSSISGGHPTPPFQSDNASLASESDFSEKDTPLTATAAYQALLNNVSSTKTAKKRQPISDSDSEDEIENALATAVRKSSNVAFEVPGPILKAEGRKESISETKIKTETKVPISSNKPQTKLSKSTRKVLGLDTSSGSEVELAVKTSLNKTAEESDEFDFYD